MKRMLLLVLVPLWATMVPSLAQDKPVDRPRRVYTTTSGEWIFSQAVIRTQGVEEKSILRFSPVFNMQHWLHVDPWRRFGFFTGISLRNVGFIYNVPNAQNITKKKYRTYNIGIPVGFKLGNMRKVCVFGGYELEFPVNYKEKTFIDERKVDKFDVWFSNRVPTMMHSLMLGIQFPKGTSLKFKYYITEFFNKDYTGVDSQGNAFKPFEEVQVNVFYVSLNYNLLRNKRFYHAKPKPKPTDVRQAMML